MIVVLVRMSSIPLSSVPRTLNPTAPSDQGESCSSMMRAPIRVDAIEMVWSTLADGCWHSRRSIINRIPTLRSTEVTAALDFLTRYGFVESSTADHERLRMVTDGPSPMEAACLLRAVGLDTESLLSHSDDRTGVP